MVALLSAFRKQTYVLQTVSFVYYNNEILKTLKSTQKPFQKYSYSSSISLEGSSYRYSTVGAPDGAKK